MTTPQSVTVGSTLVLLPGLGLQPELRGYTLTFPSPHILAMGAHAAQFLVNIAENLNDPNSVAYNPCGGYLSQGSQHVANFTCAAHVLRFFVEGLRLGFIIAERESFSGAISYHAENAVVLCHSSSWTAMESASWPFQSDLACLALGACGILNQIIVQFRAQPLRNTFYQELGNLPYDNLPPVMQADAQHLLMAVNGLIDDDAARAQRGEPPQISQRRPFSHREYYWTWIHQREYAARFESGINPGIPQARMAGSPQAGSFLTPQTPTEAASYVTLMRRGRSEPRDTTPPAADPTLSAAGGTNTFQVPSTSTASSDANDRVIIPGDVDEEDEEEDEEEEDDEEEGEEGEEDDKDDDDEDDGEGDGEGDDNDDNDDNAMDIDNDDEEENETSAPLATNSSNSAPDSPSQSSFAPRKSRRLTKKRKHSAASAAQPTALPAARRKTNRGTVSSVRRAAPRGRATVVGAATVTRVPAPATLSRRAPSRKIQVAAPPPAPPTQPAKRYDYADWRKPQARDQVRLRKDENAPDANVVLQNRQGKHLTTPELRYAAKTYDEQNAARRAARNAWQQQHGYVDVPLPPS